MRAEFHNREGWSSRGYLPHYNAGNKYQMITYRLGDSLPSSVFEDLDSKGLNKEANLLNEQEAKARREFIELALDKSYGSCLLRDKELAQKQIEVWKYFDGERYDLVAYVVMPNHVHVLIQTYVGWDVGEIRLVLEA